MPVKRLTAFGIWWHSEGRVYFADVKDTTFFGAPKKICQIIEELYNRYDFLPDSGCLNEKEREGFQRVSVYDGP